MKKKPKPVIGIAEIDDVLDILNQTFTPLNMQVLTTHILLIKKNKFSNYSQGKFDKLIEYIESQNDINFDNGKQLLLPLEQLEILKRYGNIK